MEEYWYGSPEVSGSSHGSVKFSLPIFQIVIKKIENCLVSILDWRKMYAILVCNRWNKQFISSIKNGKIGKLSSESSPF